MDDVVDGSVAVMTVLAPTATKVVNGKTIHLRTAVMACVGPAKRGTEPQANRNPWGVVINTEPKRGNGEGIEPGTRLLCGDSQEASSSGAPFSKESAKASTLWASQDFCRKAAEPTGGVCSWP